MLYLMLLIPIIAILILFVFYRSKIILLEYCFLLIPSLIILFIFKIIIVSSSYTNEYLGYYITKIRHVESWNEYIEKTCTRQIKAGIDNNGKVIYETESYDCSYVKEHPAYYQMIDNKGSSHGISSNTYYRLAHLWNTPLIFIDMHRKYHTKDGNIKEYEWDQNILNLVNITLTHRYSNKVRSAPSSIFNFEHISDSDKQKHKLYDYPKLDKIDSKSSKLIQHTLLYPDNIKIDHSINKLFDALNGLYGMQYQFRLYVMIFTNPDQFTYDKQRSFWKGGNKNEFNICIGIDPISQRVNWCNVFSWSDDRGLAIDVERLMESQQTFDLFPLFTLLQDQVPKQWKRKAFKDFEYLEVEISDSLIVTMVILLLVYNILVSIYVVQNNVFPDKINSYPDYFKFIYLERNKIDTRDPKLLFYLFWCKLSDWLQNKINIKKSKPQQGDRLYRFFDLKQKNSLYELKDQPEKRWYGFSNLKQNLKKIKWFKSKRKPRSY